MTAKVKSKAKPKPKKVKTPEFKMEFCHIAKITKIMFGEAAEDWKIAALLYVTVDQLHAWAAENACFKDSLNPTQQEVQAYRDKVDQKSRTRAARRKASMQANPGSRLRASVATRIWKCLKNNQSDGALFSRLAYSIEQLKTALEAKFTPGMTWENYGKWHVDHLRPCASFDLNDQSEFAKCWALTNLQPLWARDNLRKGAKYAD